MYGGWGQCGEVKYKSLCCVALVCSAEIPLRAVHLLPPSLVCVCLPFSEKAERVVCVCVCEREREREKLIGLISSNKQHVPYLILGQLQ